MRLPQNASAVTLDLEWRFERPYPPLGFLPFPEHELGNGDQFGLYWPIGRENEEPIVVEARHDEWSLSPMFSSLDAFLKKTPALTLDADDEAEDEHVEAPTLFEDPDSPVACYEAARTDLCLQKVEAAVAKLERAVQILPEYGEAQATLGGQYRRLQRMTETFEASLQALISSPSFGRPAIQVLRWLQKQKECPPHLQDDPIWLSRQDLHLQFGGTKINDDYLVLRRAIDVYLDQGKAVKAATLIQTYGEWMSTETVSFQERYGFVMQEYVAWQVETCASLGLNRTLSTM